MTQRPYGQLARIIDRVECSLVAIRIEILAEISLAIEQPDSDYRHSQVAGCLHLIPGYVAETSRVDGERLSQHEFHAEIGDQREAGFRVLLLEPSLSAEGFAIVA